MSVRCLLCLLTFTCTSYIYADEWFEAGLVSGGLTICATATAALTNEKKAIALQLSDKLYTASKNNNNADKLLKAGMMHFLDSLYTQEASPFPDDTRPDIISMQQCLSYELKARTLLKTLN